MKTKNFPQKKNLRRLIALRKLAEKYRASELAGTATGTGNYEAVMKTKNFPQKKNLRRLIALRKLAEKYRASDAPLWARSAMESLSAAIVSPDVARGIRTKKQRNGKRQS